MLPQAVTALLFLGSIALIGWGLIEGPTLLLIGGVVLFALTGLLHSVGDRTLSQLRKRRRGWGQPLSADERRYYGSRLVFEPTCLRPGCGGPVIELIGNRLPSHPRPFLGKVDPDLPDYYVQGPARCARCKQRYQYTIIHGGLQLKISEGEDLSRSFDPL
jgi:hypothetical protein